MAKVYDDIRELLVERKHSDISGSGASDEEITNAEFDLGVQFPLSFKQFLSEHGWGYFGSLERIVGLGSDIPKEWEAGTNIIQVVMDERSGPLRFPNHLIPISQNGAGDWYALDCSQSHEGESPVVFISHEKAAIDGVDYQQCASSFSEWLYNILSTN